MYLENLTDKHLLNAFVSLGCSDGCNACIDSLSCDSCASIDDAEYPSVFDQSLQKCVSECNGYLCQECPDFTFKKDGKCLCLDGFAFNAEANACVKDQQACSKNVLSLPPATIEDEYILGDPIRSYEPIMNYSV